MKTLLSPMEADLAVHQKLDDEPNDVGGLTAQEMKETFDKPGLLIQDYLNHTHLPQLETALAETLEEARGYADGKVVAIGSGDMAMAVYDTAGRKQDVYRFAADTAIQTLGGAARFGYAAAGKCSGSVRNSGESMVRFVDRVDPRGLWDAAKERFVVPSGAQAMLLTLHVRWGRQTFSNCFVEARINGTRALRREGPDDTTGKYVQEAVLLPLEVRGGDVVTLWVGCERSAGNLSEVYAKYLKAEIIL